MRRFAVSVVALGLIAFGGSAMAFSVAVDSSPPGAMVYASSGESPRIFLKGVTPCHINLTNSSQTYLLCVRKGGHFDRYLTVTAKSSTVSEQLASRDDPAAWARVPRMVAGDSYRRDWWRADVSDRAAEPAAGIPDSITRLAAWTRDASGVVLTGELMPGRDTEMEEEAEDEYRLTGEVWWAPAGGPPSLVSRFVSEPDPMYGFAPDADSGADPRWFVFTAHIDADRREHLVLRSVAEGKNRRIALDPVASLYYPVFSPDGGVIACLRAPETEDEEVPRDDERPSVQLQVMRWDGAQRRTLAVEVYPDGAPSFSPDGAVIAYASHDGALGMVPLVGGSPRKLSVPGWKCGGNIRWSGSGRLLAARFYRKIDNGTVARVVWLTSEGVILGAAPGTSLIDWAGEDALVLWAPGYAPSPGVRYDRLALVGLDGNLRKILWQPRLLLSRPRPSPNGNTVATLGWLSDTESEVCLIDPRTRDVREIARPELATAWDVGWIDDNTLWVRTGRPGDDAPCHALGLATGAWEPLPEAKTAPAEAQPLCWCVEGDLYQRTRADADSEPIRLTRLNGFQSWAPTIPTGGNER